MRLGLNISLTGAGAVSPLAIYAVLKFTPQLVFDFVSERYFTGYRANTFSSAITHSATSNATMVDSDGVLKWRPHNLLRYSEDFTNAAWVKTDTTVTANAAVAPDGTTTATEISHTSTAAEISQIVSGAFTGGEPYTIRFWVKYVDHQWFRVYHENGSTWFDLINGTTGTVQADSAAIEDAGDGWYLCTINNTHSTSDSTVLTVFLLADTNGSGIETSGTSVYIWGAHLYRSDLSGMVGNPDQPSGFETYVPTTSAAVYLPRRGHHVWNGSAWVNEGLLHESEARTNVLEYSAELDNGYWQKAGSRTEVIANQITAPDGTLTADLVQAITGSTTGEQYVRRSFSGLSGTYTMSAFVKKANWRYITIRAGGGIAVFDIDTATFTNLSGNVASVQDFGDGWYRISVSQTVVGTTDFPTIGIADGPTSVLWATAPTSNEGVYVWGVQYEVGPTPSSYIPTAGSTATRAAETLTVPAANLPWPTPQVIGDELVTNGDFSSGTTGWSALGGAISESGGILTVTEDGTDGATARAYQEITTEIGKVYRVQVDALTASLGNVIIAASAAGSSFGGQPQIVVTPDGSTEELFFVATVTTTTIILSVQGTAAKTATFDNVSVREINPLAVSIQMDGRVTYADEDSGNQAVFVHWYISDAERIYLRLQTDSARVGGAAFQQITGGNNDLIVETAPGSYSPGVLVPFNIAGRHGSTFVNGAVDGTALGGQGWEYGDTTPVALPDLSATDLELGYDYNGTIRTFRVWAADLGDTGIEDATLPSLEPSLSLTFDGSETSFTVSDWSE